MLNVLMVDDEPGALKAMKYLLDWEQLGFTIAGEATGGNMALDMMRQGHYDLLITDIRMPGVSGLELISRVRRHSKLPIIVVSGFEDFEYVKECLQHGVKDYLLKPVMEEDAQRILTAVKNEISHEKMISRKLDLSASAARDQMLKRWTHGNIGADEAINQLLLWGVSLVDCRSYRCLVVELDFQETMNTYMTEADIDLKRFAVRNVLEELLVGKGYMFEELPERFGIVCFGDDMAGIEETAISELAGLLQESALTYAKMPITIGIGESVHLAAEVKKSFHSAKRLLDRKFLLGSLSIITGNSFGGAFLREESTDAQEIQLLTKAVQEGDKERVIDLLHRLRDKFKTGDTPKPHVQSMVIDLLAELLRMVGKQAGGQLQVAAPTSKDYLYIMEAGTIQKLFEFAADKCMQVIAIIEESKQSGSPSAVEQVKRIVASDYAGNISLKSLAEQVHMNPVYLGQLFKASEGVSFNDYLMCLRMEKAKELLVRTDQKIYAIAYEVGYRQLDWFYKKFKEYTGHNASEYRSLHS
ncbi:response regulator [Paenibacillus mendelii]|uniref:Response regulator n=1 Tax=Paenibacillus mendelii TaxID=206163 RepID=A0ABV6J6C7_9BACL|nr:response regulator [Paenibacillus mendelii]MCQ6561192.1 response regulator [Paenibacillus mendelii]